MTIEISEIVDVNITIQDKTVSQAGFGTMLILGDNATFPERIRYYASTADVADDFLITDEEYLAAQAAFSQQPQVRQIAIGRRETAVAQVQLLDFSVDFITGNVINLKVDGVAMTPVTFTTDQATTAAALKAALEAFDSIGTVVVAGNNFTIPAALAGVPFEITNIAVTGGASQPTFTLTETIANHGIAEDLDEITDESTDWYLLITTSVINAEQLVAAAYIESKRKIYIARTADADVITSATDDIASVLQAKNYDRTAIIYNADTNDFIDAAWAGKVLPDEPGTSTWMFKELNSIVADALTNNELTNAKNKNLNVYVTIGGTDMTMQGKMVSGRFIDITHALQDYLQAKIEEAVFQTLVDAKKVPYTDAGIAIIQNDVYGVLNNFVSKKILADDPRPVVTVPKAADVSPTDRANRLLPDVDFTARGAGAIHNVEINGTITL